MTLPDIDLLDLDRWARDGAPHQWFAALRQEAPVWHHPGSGDDPGFWVVSGHEEVVALGRCPHVLSSAMGHGGVSGLGPADELQQTEDRIGAHLGTGTIGDDAAMLLTMDPPEHTAYRKIVNRGFTPRTIAGLEPRVRAIVEGALDALPAGEPVDFTTEVAMPVPMQVIGEMIGAPPAMHRDLLRWSNEAVTGTDPEYRNERGELSALEAILSLFQAFQQIEDACADGPADNLTRLLLEADVDGERLTATRLKMFLFLLALAGNETTRTAMSHAVLELARRPEQWQALRDDPSLVPGAVEEVLRYASPILYFRRNALDDLEVGGTTIPAGDIVSLWYVSANRDEQRFDRPDDFDIHRTPNEHVAFGGGGPHFCLGASLARLELRVLLTELVTRYPRVELAGPVSRLRSNFVHGIKHLPVRLEPRGAPA